MSNYGPNIYSINEKYTPIADIPIAVPVSDQNSNQPHNHEFTIITAMSPQSIRQSFVSKVYSILWLQLLVTSFFIGCCNKIKPLQNFMISDYGNLLMIVSICFMIILTCCMYCIQENLRKSPGNYLYLTVFTISCTYILGYVGIAYKLTTLLLAGISTLVIFSGLSLYAIQTKYDYTDKGGYLLAILLCLCMFGLFIPFTHYSIYSLIYSSIGSLIFSCYIVYDTQLIIGGEHRSIMFSINDYVIAAVSLYLDIINLFLMLLDLLNGVDR